MASFASSTGNLAFFGRRRLFTDYEVVDESNIIDVLTKAMSEHLRNRYQIEYLYGYYRGKQPVLNRTKDVRPEICNKIIENRANEIVSFKTGYLMGEPVQYVSRGDDSSVTEKITKLNEYVFAEDKAQKDTELAEWMHICGIGYRMCLPDPNGEEDDAPFEIYTLDPRNTFVVRSKALGYPAVLNVTYINKEDGSTVYYCYTEDRYFEVTTGIKGAVNQITKNEPQLLGLPIIEYPANTARTGAFEIVLPLLDALNNIDSNRVDAVEQFVQALMLFHNVDISSDDFEKLREQGALKFRDIDSTMAADIKYLVAELNQTQTQTLVDDMYEKVLTICGMPNRNGGTSTSDTGSAVIMRDGWSAAESRAQYTEKMFRRSENEFLKVLLRICRATGALDLKLSNIDIRFTRRNYENIVSKANVLVQLLNNDKVHPKLAFAHSGMFPDAEAAYQMSMEYYEEQQRLAQERLAQEAEAVKQENDDQEGADDGEETATSDSE